MENMVSPFAVAATSAQDRRLGMSGALVGVVPGWAAGSVSGVLSADRTYIDVPQGRAARTAANAKQGAPPRGEPR